MLQQERARRAGDPFPNDLSGLAPIDRTTSTHPKPRDPTRARFERTQRKSAQPQFLVLLYYIDEYSCLTASQTQTYCKSIKLKRLLLVLWRRVLVEWYDEKRIARSLSLICGSGLLFASEGWTQAVSPPSCEAPLPPDGEDGAGGPKKQLAAAWSLFQTQAYLRCLQAQSGAAPARAAATSAGGFTSIPNAFPTAINVGGDITGSICDNTGRCGAGFLRTRNGAMTQFSVEGANHLTPEDINNNGEVTGHWGVGTLPWRTHGFLRSQDGTIIEVNCPGASINKSGEIVGTCVDRRLKRSGFIRSPAGSYSAFAIPGARSSAYEAVNAAGTIAGEYRGSIDGVSHAFLGEVNGSLTTIDVPDGESPQIADINAAGDVVGSFVDAQNVKRGFVRTSEGTITKFDYPGATSTTPVAINWGGQIVGYYSDSTGKTHGFLRSPNGHMAPIDFPGADTTTPTDINAGGEIIGQYCGPVSSATYTAVCNGFVTAPGLGQ
jgi:probable HAF family extracellular repeat protein